MTNVGNLGFDLRFNLEAAANKLNDNLTKIKSSVGIGNNLGMEFSSLKEITTKSCNIKGFLSSASKISKDSPKAKKGLKIV